MIKNKFFCKIIITSFLCFIMLNNSPAQQNNISGLMTGFNEFAKKPLNWDKDDLLKLGLITGATVGLFFIDNEARSFSVINNKYSRTIPAEAARIYGEPYATGSIALLLALQGWSASNNKNLETSFQIIQSFSYTAIATGILKFSFGRSRPFTNASPATFNPFQSLMDKDHSFPSGHTSVAFSLSTILYLNNQDNKAAWLYFIPAISTAFSRVYQNYHWLSDVFFGACIGYFTAKFTYDLNNSNKTEPVPPVPVLTLTISL